ncbi:hypothetical protein ACLGI4_03045 [Streptomyces sp. HMX112]|uniref:hypothetical protein n=1 Tax=Streptomyces sp. HMX112 TaxID=3390850 RepID=UPI003A80EB53
MSRPDGELHLAGCLALTFKTARGEMINREPVEAHLLAHPGVTAACLLGHGLLRAVVTVLDLAGRGRVGLAGLAGRAGCPPQV